MTEVYGPQLPGEQETPTARGRTKRRGIRYAPGHMDLFRTGASDNPMSQSFVALEDRDGLEKARYFAKRKKKPQTVVEFD